MIFYYTCTLYYISVYINTSIAPAKARKAGTVHLRPNVFLHRIRTDNSATSQYCLVLTLMDLLISMTKVSKFDSKNQRIKQTNVVKSYANGDG